MLITIITTTTKIIIIIIIVIISAFHDTQGHCVTVDKKGIHRIQKK